MYSAEIGRWMAPDPWEEDVSPYIYVANDPVNFFDPNGKGKFGNWLKGKANDIGDAAKQVGNWVSEKADDAGDAAKKFGNWVKNDALPELDPTNNSSVANKWGRKFLNTIRWSNPYFLLDYTVDRLNGESHEEAAYNSWAYWGVKVDIVDFYPDWGNWNKNDIPNEKEFWNNGIEECDEYAVNGYDYDFYSSNNQVPDWENLFKEDFQLFINQIPGSIENYLEGNPFRQISNSNDLLDFLMNNYAGYTIESSDNRYGAKLYGIKVSEIDGNNLNLYAPGWLDPNRPINVPEVINPGYNIYNDENFGPIIEINGRRYYVQFLYKILHGD